MRWEKLNKNQIQCWRTWDRDNLGKKIKKNDLVKIPKLATLITRLRYPYGKQIKTDYEDQFPTDPILNDKTEKINKLNKTQKTTRDNSG